jgi:hypothetical protein
MIAGPRESVKLGKNQRLREIQSLRRDPSLRGERSPRRFGSRRNNRAFEKHRSTRRYTIADYKDRTTDVRMIARRRARGKEASK